MKLHLILLAITQLCWATRFKGRFLRIGYTNNPKAVIVERRSDLNEVTGKALEMVQWLSRRAGFQYTLVEIDYTDRFNGLPAEFEKKKLDLGVSYFGLAYGRNHIADLLFPYAFGENTLIIPYPTVEPNILSCVLPFKPLVWICYFISMLLVSLMLKLVTTFQHWETGEEGYFMDLGNAAMYVIGVSTNQGTFCYSKSRSSRLVAAVWCLATLVLVNAYSGSLITYMSTAQVTPLVSSLEDLATKSDKVQLLFLTNSFLRVTFEKATTGMLGSLAPNVARYPNTHCGLLFASSGCIDQVKTGGHAMAVELDQADFLISQDFQKTGACRLTSIEKPFMPTYYGFAVPLNSSHAYRNSLDVHSLEAVSFGFLSPWSKKYTSERNPCLLKSAQPSKKRTFTIRDLFGAFFILGTGILLSFTAFLYEMATGLKLRLGKS